MHNESSERRANTKYGLTTGEWIMILLAALSGVASFAVVSDDVKDNAAAIERVEKNNETHKRELRTETKDVEKRLKLNIQESELRTREDIRELREIILNEKIGHGR